MTAIESAWRSIPAKDVQWDATPSVPHRVTWNLYRQCRPHSGARPLPENTPARWHDKTLGDIADMGERAWRKAVDNCGPKTIEAIRLTIDYAAAGYCVTAKIDAYRPRAWKVTI